MHGQLIIMLVTIPGISISRQGSTTFPRVESKMLPLLGPKLLCSHGNRSCRGLPDDNCATGSNLPTGFFANGKRLAGHEHPHVVDSPLAVHSSSVRAYLEFF